MQTDSNTKEIIIMAQTRRDFIKNAAALSAASYTKSEESKFFKGYYHYMIQDYPEALDLLNNCLAVNDRNLPAHTIKTLCLLKMGRFDEAVVTVKGAYQLAGFQVP